jgi:hypothetical protein
MASPWTTSVAQREVAGKGSDRRVEIDKKLAAGSASFSPGADTRTDASFKSIDNNTCAVLASEATSNA